jgi:hypothetical protein
MAGKKFPGHNIHVSYLSGKLRHYNIRCKRNPVYISSVAREQVVEKKACNASDQFSKHGRQNQFPRHNIQVSYLSGKLRHYTIRCKSNPVYISSVARE